MGLSPFEQQNRAGGELNNKNWTPLQMLSGIYLSMKMNPQTC
jgi:hypothetical protein